MQTKEEVLQACTVNGFIVKLPPVVLDRKLYEDVKNVLGKIGGKWKGGKTQGFEFPHDPKNLLEEVAGGANRNLKKEFQYFPTPASLAKRMVELAGIHEDDMICEPSAGQGAIVKEILKQHPGALVHCFELMEQNRSHLEKIKDCIILGEDFFNAEYFHLFKRFVANPPFANNQDIEHIQQMYRHCNHGGRIVSVASNHWRTSKNRKETDFKKWLWDLNATIEDVPAGTFKESGTNIETCLIIIDKK